MGIKKQMLMANEHKQDGYSNQASAQDKSRFTPILP